MLYRIATNQTTFEWFYQDMIVVLPITMTMGLTNAFPKLSTELPDGKLISLPIIA